MTEQDAEQTAGDDGGESAVDADVDDADTDGAEGADNIDDADGAEGADNIDDADGATNPDDEEPDAEAGAEVDVEFGEEPGERREEADVSLDDLDDALVERVSDADPESIARELGELRVTVERLEGELAEREAEIEELSGKLKRKQADFQNYKKRMEKRREEESQRATEDLVERLLDVRDNLVRALDQEDADAEALRDGVETTLSQFDRVLDDENVDVVEPEPGDEVDPHTHEVLMRVDSEQPADTIADVHRPGYVMAEKVIRPAQVTVSE